MLSIFPINVFAYSKYIIPGGSTVGIEVSSKGVLVVGLYDINNNSNKDFKIGDRIIKINNTEVNKIEDMINIINKETDYTQTFEFLIYRNDKEYKITTKLFKDDKGILKTGLYVKDQINGIGTLTFIDPKTRIFGALGHEIIDKNTASKFEIKDGHIYEAVVDSITKSREGEAGEKNAKYSIDNSIGIVEKNTKYGIFGKIDDVSNQDKLEVGKIKDIHTGKAIIKTVINGQNIEEFDINIIRLDSNSQTKNILFEVIDNDLLEKTGGIIQGMSGSPIIQDGKIIGAVTHVIMNDVKRGYGIFITNMLEEGER